MAGGARLLLKVELRFMLAPDTDIVSDRQAFAEDVNAQMVNFHCELLGCITVLSGIDTVNVPVLSMLPLNCLVKLDDPCHV